MYNSIQLTCVWRGVLTCKFNGINKDIANCLVTNRIYMFFKFPSKRKKRIICYIFFYQSKDYINYWRKWVSMKRWTVSLFRGLPRRRRTCCQCPIIKSEYVKFVMHKKMRLIFCATQKWNFTFFWHVVILLLSYRIKIHHHDITVLKAQNKNLVLRKKTLCLKKSWFCTKSKVVPRKTS